MADKIYHVLQKQDCVPLGLEKVSFVLPAISGLRTEPLPKLAVNSVAKM